MAAQYQLVQPKISSLLHKPSSFDQFPEQTHLYKQDLARPVSPIGAFDLDQHNQHMQSLYFNRMWQDTIVNMIQVL